MDNVQFNVRGEGTEGLLEALKLAFLVSGHRTACGYHIDKKKGLVLYWVDAEDIQKFMFPMTAEQLYGSVVTFLEDFFKDNTYGIELSEDMWDASANDCDIEDYPGWRVYTEEWGHVDDNWRAFVAITPSYCWSSQ